MAKPKRSSVLLDENTDAAAQAIEDRLGLTRSNLVSQVLAEHPAPEDLLAQIPQGIRRNFTLMPEQWEEVAEYVKQGRKGRSSLVKADIIRAALKLAIAHYQQKESSAGGAPPG